MLFICVFVCLFPCLLVWLLGVLLSLFLFFACPPSSFFGNFLLSFYFDLFCLGCLVDWLTGWLVGWLTLKYSRSSC